MPPARRSPGAGELWVAGSNVFAGYWRAPEKNCRELRYGLRRPRWFGLAIWRAAIRQRALRPAGPSHELIIAGVQRYPREIEEALRPILEFARPWCGAAACRVGRGFFAFASRTPSCLEREVIAWCKTQLASFKAPHGVRVIEALPRNALGKVQKHLLPKDH